MTIGSIISGAAEAASKLVNDGYGMYRDNIADNQWARDRSMNKKMAYDFAQNQIKWRVQDAKEAGIHPLFALGAQTISPSFGAGSSFHSGVGAQADLSSLGQGIDRAISAKATAKERAESEYYNNQTRMNELRRQELTNKQLEGDIAIQQATLSAQTIRNQQATPPMQSVIRPDGAVIAGQSGSTRTPGSLVNVVPSQTETNAPGRLGTAAASIPDLSFARTNDGGYAPVPSKEVKERIEDDVINETLWKVRNHVPSVFSMPSVAPPYSWLPKGSDEWYFNPLKGAWYPRSRTRNRFSRDDRNPYNWGR